MKKQWKRLAALSSAVVMAAGTLLYFPTDTLQNISWGITASAEETGAGTESGSQTWNEDDGLTWTLTADGTLTISGKGEMKEYYNSDVSPATQKTDSVKKVVIANGVTSIGKYAFKDCSNLASIEIPEGVTSIGYYAFQNCSNLASIEIPSSVTSIGSGAFYACTSFTSITIPDNVTSIGDYAFGYCSSLTSITIPKSVESVGDRAFYGCDKLTEVLLENGSELTSESLGVDENIIGTYWNEGSLTWALDADGTLTIRGTGPMRDYLRDSPATRKRASVKRVEIGKGVTSIGEFAFYDCSRLTSITIPSGVTSIGDYAFHDCSSLTDITILGGVTSIGSFAFFNCTSLTGVTIPSSVTSIGVGVFDDCTALKEVLLENGSKLTSGNLGVDASKIRTYWNEDNLTWTLAADGTLTISGSGAMKAYGIDGSPAAQKKDSVKKVVIEDGVTSIGNFAFFMCSNLISITIPSSVTSIGNSAFYNCPGLTSIEIPEGVTSIGNYAFSDCTSLTSINIPEGVTSIGDSAFSGTLWLTNKRQENDSLVIVNGILIDGTACSGEVTIPDGVASIGGSAFFGCSNMTSINIPKSVTSIENSAFYNCTGLTSLEIPDSVTSIGIGAFQNCTGLTSVEIPEGVTSIGNYAFMSCDGLTSITIPKSVTSIGGNVFNHCSSLKEVLLEGGSTLTSENFGEVADKVVTRWNEGDLTWTLTADGTMTISGTGAMKNYDANNSPVAQKTDSVKKL